MTEATHPCALENGAYEHDWTTRTDWDGDPGVINGTRTWQTVVCSRCGIELLEIDAPGAPDGEATSILYTTRRYPCGCEAHGQGDVPAYCSTHGTAPIGHERLMRACEPFVNVLKKSRGRMPYERLSAADWHELTKAYDALAGVRESERVEVEAK